MKRKECGSEGVTPISITKKPFPEVTCSQSTVNKKIWFPEEEVKTEEDITHYTLVE